MSTKYTTDELDLLSDALSTAVAVLAVECEKHVSPIFESFLKIWNVHVYEATYKTLFRDNMYIGTLLNTFAAKHLKNPIPQCQACLKDSWILRVYGFYTVYLKNHSAYCREIFSECC